MLSSAYRGGEEVDLRLASVLLPLGSRRRRQLSRTAAQVH